MRIKQLLISLALSGLALSVHAAANETTLKVCAAADEMPYSNQKGEGFENKLAQFLGAELHKKIELVFWKDPRYFLRDYLDKNLCDVVMGIDTGDPRVATTKPYYRSGYVFISREADNLDLQNWHSSVLKKAQRIAFVPATPAEVMLRAIGRYNDMFNYQQELVGYRSKRNEYVKYDTPKLVSEVSSGHAELAVLWGPSAARYVKESTVPLTMTLISDNNKRADGEKVGHHYSTSMAVRKGNDALLTQLNRVIEQQQHAITDTLETEGIPLVSE
jgi:mxaJ protein